MNQDQQQIFSVIASQGSTIVLNSKTGDVCPCMNSGDGDRVGYSAEWHRLNPTQENCNGSGIIDADAENINCSTILYGYTDVRNAAEELKSIIGEIQQDDLFIIGLLDQSDWSEINMSTISEQDDYFTYNGNTYSLRWYKDTQVTKLFVQIGLLTRRS